MAGTAYGLFCGMTFPLTFEIYKPKERLREGDKYRTQPEIAAQMIGELQELGWVHPSLVMSILTEFMN